MSITRQTVDGAADLYDQLIVNFSLGVLKFK